VNFLLNLLNILGELGMGTAFFVAVQKTGEIRKSFFSFQAMLTACCFFLIALSTEKTHFFQSPFFIAALISGFASWSFSKERYRAGKIILIISALLAAFFLFRATFQAPPKLGSRCISILNLIGGTALFSWVSGTMVLGHWYLVMRGLSFSHFQRATMQVLVMVVLRSMLFLIVCVAMRNFMVNGRLWIMADPLFFWSRVVWGLILPAIFGFMAWRCARIGSNQAGTGLLYIAQVSALIGEILAGFVGI
jgi:hypothetical protein